MSELTLRDPYELLPCPVCGRGLTWGDLSFYDEDGAPMTLGTEEADFIALDCGCGYLFGQSADKVDYPCSGWLETFCKLANRRAGQ